MLSFLCRILLLVAFLAVIAHAHILPHSKNAMTSLPSAAGDAKSSKAAQAYHSRRNLLSLEDSAVAVRASFSVVQDWSLVCKQLCGAGLGGAPCASYCTTIDIPEDVQRRNAETVLNPNRNLICQDLCRLQLGDVTCNCISTTEKDVYAAAKPQFTTVDDRNMVCSSFCVHNGATLTGCSLCKEDDRVSSEQANDNGQTAKIRAVVLNAANFIPAAAAALDNRTPDWKELCVTLCKTGDGGSLCNCDLSPFF